MTASRGENASRIVVLLNKGSGKHDETQAIEDRVTAAMPGAQIRTIKPGADIAAEVARAREEGCTTIVAAGGDGTISGVSGALTGTDTTLGVLPLGTFNFFARSLGIPEEIEQASDVIDAGRTQKISVGEINGCVFVNNASLGAYAAILEAREAIYARWGRSRLAAYWSVVVAMLTLYRPLEMRVTVDGTAQTLRSPMAFFAIRRYQLEEYGLAGCDKIDEGKILLFLAPDSGRAMLLWRALKVLLRLVEPGSDYRVLSGKEFEVQTSKKKTLVARDGEQEPMEGPFRVRILPDALTVLVPGQGALDA